ncbi:hypothetical protein K7432_007413 [Basidiobolus ranarum]|uniref:Uncharacterized protein n=1 Tax=Basidiobolus ranarum TaxID=34480 RepID=A0ABR2WTD8_9FUNG
MVQRFTSTENITNTDTTEWNDTFSKFPSGLNARKHFKRSSYCDSLGLSDSQETVEKPLRSKWTSEETELLIKGCYEYGIGAWKKIFQDPKYSFPGRTAVDLKDRFRTVFPQQYKLLYPTRVYSRTAPLSTTNIDFRRVYRRPRKRFTQEDDSNLLLGVEKYGCSWSRIAKDSELKLSDRHSMDLRDRFRIAFPESYERFGYVPKTTQQTPRLVSRIRRKEICAELIREESREFNHANSHTFEEPVITPSNNVPNSSDSVNDVESSGSNSGISNSSDRTMVAEESNEIVECTPDVDLSKWDQFNNHAEIMFSTPLPGVRLNRCSPVNITSQLFNVSYSRGNKPSCISKNSKYYRHIPIRKSLKNKSRSKDRRVSRGSWSIESTRVQYSPVKKALAQVGIASSDIIEPSTHSVSDPEFQASSSLLSKGEQIRYSPIKKAQRSKADQNSEKRQELLASRHRSPTCATSPMQSPRYSPIRRTRQISVAPLDCSSSTGDQVPDSYSTLNSNSTRGTSTETAIQVSGSYCRTISAPSAHLIDRLNATLSDSDGSNTESVKQTTKFAPICVRRSSESVRFSPVRKDPNHSPNLVGDFPDQQAPVKPNSLQPMSTTRLNAKIVRYSPIRHISCKIPKIVQPESLNPPVASRRLPCKSVDLLNIYHEQSYTPYENTHTHDDGHPQTSESEMPSIPELIEEPNEGSDYESSDFIDTITPNLEVSGYPSLSITCPTQALISSPPVSKAFNIRDQLLTPFIQPPSGTSENLMSTPNTTGKNKATESNCDSRVERGKDLNNSSMMLSSATGPLQGKIVGARIRNGEVEYKFKFRSVWKPADAVENEGSLVQNFMDTLVSKSSFISLLSADSNSTMHE